MSVVVTLSTQSIASLAVAHSLSPGETARKLAGFLRKLGVKAVADAGTGRDLALLEGAAEFIQRYKGVHPQNAGEPQMSDVQYRAVVVIYRGASVFALGKLSTCLRRLSIACLMSMTDDGMRPMSCR